MGSLAYQVALADSVDERDAEAAWRSVIKYYGTSDDEYLLGLARERLAEIYLDRGELTKALAEYRELYTLAGNAEPEMKARALAGQYEIYEQQGKLKEMDEVRTELLPRLDDLRGGPFDNTVRARLEQGVEKKAREVEAARDPKPATAQEGAETAPNASGGN